MKRDFKSVTSLLTSGNQAKAVSTSSTIPTVAVSDMKHRFGSVLDSSTIIKVDDYQFRKNASHSKSTWFSRRISGAEELRVAEGTCLLGVSQPTVPGVRGILDSLGAGRNIVGETSDSWGLASRRKVLWVNLREEPLLYLNGRPIVLRERTEPFRNMETFKGINESRLRDLEWRFKEDVVAEAQRCGGSILLHEEERENQLIEKWESAPPNVVMTPEDVFFQLRQEGYRVRYERLPCTSGQPPSPSFFDEILRCVVTTDRDTWIVFNCQSGNARSTLAMIATYAIQTRRGFWSIEAEEEGRFALYDALASDRRRYSSRGPRDGSQIVEDLNALMETPPPPSGPVAAPQSTLPPRANSPGLLDKEKDETTKQLLAGWYLPILQLLRLLVGGGREAKTRMDEIIDQCSHTSNIRTEILRFRAKAANSRDKSYRSLFASRASVALQRYMLLILWESYLAERSVREGLSRHQSGGMPNKGSSSVFEELGASSPQLGASSFDLEAMAKSHQRSFSRDILAVTFAQGAESTSFSMDYRPTFAEWVESRKEIVSLLKSVRANPEQALEGPDVNVISSDGASSESRMVMQARRGVMLNTDTILKLDDFEHQDVDETAADSQTKGGRNFRRVPGMRVYGVSTPAVFNAKALIRVLQTSHGAERLLFCNLREEPFVYVNEKPFVLRSVHRPFRNLDAFAEIDVKRLEKAEERMKREILEEADRYNGKILVHVEGRDGSLKVMWEEIEDEEAVQTPKEVFANFSQSEILPVSYVRIPMTPEVEPNLSDIDDVLGTVRASKSEPGTHFVFFCQRGRGRSTLATVLACLELDEFVPTDDAESLTLMRGSGALPSEPPIPDAVPDRDALLSPPLMMDRSSPSVPGRSADADLKMPQQSHVEGDLASIHTDFPPMLSLMRVLRHGTLAKRWLDATIDRCGAVYNLRRNILVESAEASSSRSEEQSQALLDRALLDLRKYFILLEAAGYCIEMKGQTSVSTSFKHWCASRPELLTLKEEIHNKAALDVIESESVHGASAESDLNGGGQDTFSGMSDRALVANRDGRVLVRGSILKTDHFPGCRRLPDPRVDIDGAPNFRAVWPEGKLDDIDLRVYGTGIPTEMALKEILELLNTTSHLEKQSSSSRLLLSGTDKPSSSLKPQQDEDRSSSVSSSPSSDKVASPGEKRLSSRLSMETNATTQPQRDSVVWINLREEPILFVNGRPFVLRRLDEPFANLEHTGISRHRVEEMEVRFKEDVLDEAKANRDYSVLIHEEDETGGLKPKWERVESVFTSRELFDAQRDKFDVQYWRVPITDEQSPKPSAFDAIVDIVAATKPTSHIVFNCQMGRGRTTSGLIVASATRLRMIGALRRFASVVDTKIAPNRKFRSKIRSNPTDLTPDVAKELRGDYLAIIAQLRLIDEGFEAKRAMDALIDVCDAMQNLREAVHEVKVRSYKVDLSPALRAEALGVAEHYLKRYAHLVQFGAYLLSCPDLGPKRVKFANWLKARPELGNALKSLIGDEKKSLLSS